MTPQYPNSASLSQTLRALKKLALSDAFMQELQLVAAEMNTQAFQPAPLVAADGSAVLLDMQDTSHGPAEDWVPYPGPFAQVLTTQQLRPIPPYPMLQLLGEEGADVPGSQADQSALSVVQYTIDAVVMVAGDNPDAVSVRAMAYADAFWRLVARNEHLGGLVYLIATDGPPVPGGEVEQAGAGVVSGVLQRFQARALRVG